MGTALEREQVLVTTDWLFENLDSPGIRILDCRYYFDRDGREEYDRGHIPGALHLDHSKDLADLDAPVESMIAPPEVVQETMRRLGINTDTLIVAYDDEGGHFAARVRLVLERYGRESQIRILDGGWTKWVLEGRPVATDVFQVSRGNFEIDPEAGSPEIVATAEDVATASSIGSCQLLDVRRLSEFTGEEIRAKYGGRIPNAFHAFWHNNLNWESDRTFRSDEEIRSRDELKGVDLDEPLITYCQGGVRAAHAALALRLAGYTNVRVYDGSWAEWGNRDDLPRVNRLT